MASCSCVLQGFARFSLRPGLLLAGDVELPCELCVADSLLVAPSNELDCEALRVRTAEAITAASVTAALDKSGVPMPPVAVAGAPAT